MNSMKPITALQVRCPTCGRGPRRRCRGSRIPGANTLGGGWGGPPDLQRPHKERVERAKHSSYEPCCNDCGMILDNGGPCENGCDAGIHMAIIYGGVE